MSEEASHAGDSPTQKSRHSYVNVPKPVSVSYSHAAVKPDPPRVSVKPHGKLPVS